MMLKTLDSFSRSRLVWLLLFSIALMCLLIAHFLMQEYLLIPPCEQCVYIRYAFVVLGIGCLIVAINPKNMFLKVVGMCICLFALVRGITFALTLNAIYQALKEGKVFGLKGCSLQPVFDFHLPLDVWIPQLFKPLGFCGLDTPQINTEILSPLQESLIAFYTNGWYLIPHLQIGTMAQCALVVFLFYGIALCALGIGSLKGGMINALRTRKSLKGV